MLFLHGAAEWIGYSSAFADELAREFRVIQPERQGHGRTPDREGDLTYAGMTEDTAALIEEMSLSRPEVVGFSDGAIIALELAMSHPETVGRVVAIAPNISVSGLTDQAREWLDAVSPESWPEYSARHHRELSPDGPNHWPVFVRKVIDMLRREPEIPLRELARIESPVLVVGGDRDLVRLEHFVDIHRAIPRSELCVLPGTSHDLTVEQPALLAEVTLGFLKKDTRSNRP